MFGMPSNEKAIEKAKLIVHTSAVEWEKTLSAVLQWNIARESLHETIEPVVMFLPGAMLVGYFYRIIDSIVQNDPDNLAFYQKQAMVTLGLYWESLVKAVRKEPRKQLREVLDIAIRNGETDLLPTDELELRELFDKRFKTSGNHETPPDSRGEEESKNIHTTPIQGHTAISASKRHVQIVETSICFTAKQGINTGDRWEINLANSSRSMGQSTSNAAVATTLKHT